jgi:hypothetical protein
MPEESGPSLFFTLRQLTAITNEYLDSPFLNRVCYRIQKPRVILWADGLPLKDLESLSGTKRSPLR